ncbi:hypothetical protein O181_082822 [Austropuccinia psidii MF-1]|uniref:Uncharacterized protein n=1 Tax=Austropuccinia psidii MF-1 TaxID=1389203 RepID=A0A9Q3FTA9_9BASI|nr:hypothetical protein [Austropuccinia psidii MF-1]
MARSHGLSRLEQACQSIVAKFSCLITATTSYDIARKTSQAIPTESGIKRLPSYPHQAHLTPSKLVAKTCSLVTIFFISPPPLPFFRQLVPIRYLGPPPPPPRIHIRALMAMV